MNEDTPEGSLMSATEREKTTKPGDEKNKIRASNTYYSVAVTAEGVKKFYAKRS